MSLTNKASFDSLFLYTDLDKNAVVNNASITLTHDHFFLVGYNEKLFLPTLKSTFLEYERTKVYWLNWMERTPTYKRYNNYIARSAMTPGLLSYEKSGAILAQLRHHYLRLLVKFEIGITGFVGFEMRLWLLRSCQS